MTIKIYEEFNEPFIVSPSTGEKIFDLFVKKREDEDTDLVLDFSDIFTFTSSPFQYLKQKLVQFKDADEVKITLQNANLSIHTSFKYAYDQV